MSIYNPESETTGEKLARSSTDLSIRKYSRGTPKKTQTALIRYILTILFGIDEMLKTPQFFGLRNKYEHKGDQELVP